MFPQSEQEIGRKKVKLTEKDLRKIKKTQKIIKHPNN